MKLIAIGSARVNSKRCKNKMLRPFADTTLVELAVRRLGKLSNFDGVYFGAYENELIEIAKNNLPSESVKSRTKEMANSERMEISNSWLLDIDFDYCMFVNSCHAQLKPETLDKAAGVFRKEQFRSMTSVRKRYTWFYNQEGESINNKDSRTQVRSQEAIPIFEVAHAFHVFQKKHFFSTKSYWNNAKNDPFLYLISDIEALDVDTEEDFFISEAVYTKFSANTLNS